MMTRRTFLSALTGLVAGTESASASPPAAPPPAAPGPAVDRLELPEAEWKKRLTSMQFNVLRREGTERPFTSALNAEKRKGVYQCAGCDLPLFSSDMKYDSGTGWPSFHTALAGAFATRTDFMLFYARTEYHCARCGGHHGHVFDDGPAPTGKRYCNNGVALRFVAAA